MEKNSGIEIFAGSSSSRGHINNRHDPGNLKEKYSLFKRTKTSIVVYILYTTVSRSKLSLLQIFIICFIQTESVSSLQWSHQVCLICWACISHLISRVVFAADFLSKHELRFFVGMKGRIVRLQFLLFYQDFLKRKTTGHCIDVNKYK